MIEGPIISIAMYINVFSMQVYFIPPGIFTLIFLVIFFIYSKKPIVECRQLYLKQRSPVFGIFGEMITSLSQIHIFDKRLHKLRSFAAAADLSTKTNMSFQVISRGFGAYVSFASSLIMIIAFYIGIYFSNSST
jgi:ABC-type bacteriocin/lantibiotic exporter with double-glycine peptidase domain